MAVPNRVIGLEAEERTMAQKKGRCQTGKVSDPGKCSPAQIRKCHGKARKHPCARKDLPEIGY